jgi:hypothetical protein
MNDNIMTYGYPVANADDGFLVEAMKDAAILDIYCVSNKDPVHVTPDHCVKPHTAVIAYYYLADYGSVIS